MKFNLPNQEKSLFITFESGYENVKIYFDGALIGKVESSEQLVDGVTIPASPAGTIDLRFPTGRRSLEVRVDELLCTPETPAQELEELRSFDRYFWALTILGLAGTVIQIYILQPYLTLPAVLIQIFISGLAVIAYLVAAILTRQGKAWAYLLGTIVFTIMTLYYILSVHLLGWQMADILVVIVRLVILALLYYKMTSVFTYFKKTNDLSSSHTLLDDF